MSARTAKHRRNQEHLEPPSPVKHNPGSGQQHRTTKTGWQLAALLMQHWKEGLSLTNKHLAFGTSPLPVSEWR